MSTHNSRNERCLSKPLDTCLSDPSMCTRDSIPIRVVYRYEKSISLGYFLPPYLGQEISPASSVMNNLSALVRREQCNVTYDIGFFVTNLDLLASSASNSSLSSRQACRQSNPCSRGSFSQTGIPDLRNQSHPPSKNRLNQSDRRHHPS